MSSRFGSIYLFQNLSLLVQHITLGSSGWHVLHKVPLQFSFTKNGNYATAVWANVYFLHFFETSVFNPYPIDY